jgi:hypothetical protein
LAVTCSLALLGLAACAGGATPGPASAPAPPAAAGFNYRDSDSLCPALAQALFTTDTTTDTSPLDPYRRAAMYLTAPLARAATQATGRDSDWWRLQAHRAATHVSVQTGVGDDQPVDTTAVRYRKVVATVGTTSPGGWTEPPSTRVVYCTLSSSAAGLWRVSSYEVDYVDEQ